MCLGTADSRVIRQRRGTLRYRNMDPLLLLLIYCLKEKVMIFVFSLAPCRWFWLGLCLFLLSLIRHSLARRTISVSLQYVLQLTHSFYLYR
jgi:hypothetical protein